MAAEPDTMSAELDTWLARLDDAGFALGIRERLTVLTLFAKLAANGSLPADAGERLRLIGPLVSSSPTDQRNYNSLLQRFVV